MVERSTKCEVTDCGCGAYKINEAPLCNSIELVEVNNG